MTDRDVLMKRFVEITGREDGVARFYLSCSNWVLDDALCNYFANQKGDDVSEAFARLKIKQQMGQANTDNSVDNFDKRDVIAAPKVKVTTLKDMSANNNDNENVELQTSFREAGPFCSQQQQVLGPPRPKIIINRIDQMFCVAKCRCIRTESSSDSKWGQGMRLGETADDHRTVLSAEEVNKPLVVLKLWRSGFTVDDGELRPYNDPDNAEFLETVMCGEVPEELLVIGWEVNMDVEDHRHEDYKKKTHIHTQRFTGTGHALGCTPSKMIDPPANANSLENNGLYENNEEIAKENLKLDVSQPCTIIQIRLADGSRFAAQFNLSHTVADIQNYIRTARPQYANKDFILVSSFPTIELTDETLTIEATGLKNATLMQRFK